MQLLHPLSTDSACQLLQEKMRDTGNENLFQVLNFPFAFANFTLTASVYQEQVDTCMESAKKYYYFHSSSPTAPQVSTIN